MSFFADSTFLNLFHFDFNCQTQFLKNKIMLWLMTLYIINSKSFYCVWSIINLRILIVAMIEDKMIQVLGHIKFMLSIFIYILSSRYFTKEARRKMLINSNSKLGQG